jgi:chromosome segregation ATPase
MKKLGITLLILAGAFFVFKKTHLGSYIRTAWAGLKSSAKNQVPLEFEIERVRQEIAKLDDDIRDHLSPMAEEMANIKSLKTRIRVTKENLKKEEANILTMTRDLEKCEKDGTQAIYYGEDEYTPEQVKAKLDRDFASYRLAEAELKSQQKMLEAKDKSMRVNREKLAKMKSLKRDLEVQLANIEADLKAVRLAEATDQFQVDDTRLSGIKSSLDDIRHRIDVRRNKVELHGQFANDPIPVHKKPKSATDLTREVKNYFKKGKTSDKEQRVAVGEK